MPRITLATFNVAPPGQSTRKYQDMGPVAVARLAHYAKRHGYGFISRPNAPDFHPVCWEKFGVIRTALHQSDWCVWVDSDAMPIDLARPLEPILRPDVDMISQCPVTYLTRLNWPAQRCRLAMPFNSGVFAIRNMPAVHDLLNAAEAMRPPALPQNTAWDGLGDQEAIIAALRDHPVRMHHEPDLQCHPGDLGVRSYFVHFYGNHADHIYTDSQAHGIIANWHGTMGDRLGPAVGAAHYHWANIQNRFPGAALTRGGPERFLYQPDEIHLT